MIEEYHKRLKFGSSFGRRARHFLPPMEP